MNIFCYTSRNPFQTNGYVITTEKKNAVLIDAPLIPKQALEKLENDGVKITKILLTHGHCDHIDSLAFLAEKYGAKVFIHENDEEKLHNDFLNLSEYFADCYTEKVPHYEGAEMLRGGDVITEDELSFKVIHTPGHTGGSVCYIAENVIFSGDTLFKGSIGRTDMPDGNAEALKSSLNMLKNFGGLEEDYNIFSGHGNPTLLSEEKRRNPYLKGDIYDDLF